MHELYKEFFNETVRSVLVQAQCVMWNLVTVTDNVVITWELVGNAASQLCPRPTESECEFLQGL